MVVALTEECSAIVQYKLPPKLKDSGQYTISFCIGTLFTDKALCNLGASINQACRQLSPPRLPYN